MSYQLTPNQNLITLHISLPAANGKIDYSFMDTFISAIQKLVIADVVRYTDRKIAATRRMAKK
ncbi:MAG: hypothetical protein LBR26_14235 [Prevotella sp.]|jgi:hypothetical protein|nr:hypothetical protein [Prevotella sp.]